MVKVNLLRVLCQDPLTNGLAKSLLQTSRAVVDPIGRVAFTSGRAYDARNPSESGNQDSEFVMVCGKYPRGDGRLEGG